MTTTTEQKPELTCEGLTFFPIPAVKAVTISMYFPRHKQVPVPRKYENLVDTFFFCGGTLPDMQPAVDRHKATAWVHAMLSSWLPPHECKVRTIGYALWLWCEGDLPQSEGH